jgi:hypothetical protein
MNFRWGHRKNKHEYGPKTADGFGSKLEKAVYQQLLAREGTGEIKDIKRQQTVVLQERAEGARIAWKLDFSAVRCANNETFYIEAKGFETADYKMKLNLWRKKTPAKLEIWKGNHSRPFFAEVINKKETT